MSVEILLGDVRERLAGLPPDHFDCVVTSPPYWGLRDYGVAGQIGLEPTLGEHMAVMVEVFRAVRRVMKPEATLWLNYGDCYATTPNGRSAADTKEAGGDDRTFRDKPFSTIGGVLKPKDLCMLPNRLAIALQEDGWWVRSEIVWGKPSPMPDSSGKYRPSTAHEKIFLLSRTARCHYDPEAVAQPVSGNAHARVMKGYQPDGSTKPPVGRKSAGEDTNIRAKGSMNAALVDVPEGRYLRNFEPAPLATWVIPARPFPEAHFATFPPQLAQLCLMAGCPPGSRVLDPFGGAGTVGLVADRMGLDATLIELNPDYAAMAERRIRGDGGMLCAVAVHG